MLCNDSDINNAATQGEAQARTDARSDHAVLDFSLPTGRQVWLTLLYKYTSVCSFGLIQKNQKIKDDMIAPRVLPCQRLPLCSSFIDLSNYIFNL